MTASIALEPIGFVRTDAPADAVKSRWESLVSEIEILESYEPGLAGIDGFSHLIVLFFMDRLPAQARSTLLVKPRGLLRLGLTLEELPTVGVFACDSPARPNPIGVSIVALLGRRGRVLRVRGLDALDGTPVVDLKPYTPDRAIRDPATPRWHQELVRKSGAPRV